jgi:YVTN family beta-propeller protein
MRKVVASVVALLIVPAPCAMAEEFVHFESPHVHPLELMPGGARVVAVNTADSRIEVFDVLAGAPYLRHAGSISVGLEPVSVRARTSTEAWVVNNVSDSISVVDLAAMRVVTTIDTGDEPCDVVFAGSPQRAFVSASGRDRIEVFDPSAPHAPPTPVPLAGKMPRALATDGARVHAAFFGASNETTILSESVVSSALSPYPGSPNPPPNDGLAFSPELNPSIPAPPPGSLIVRRDSDGAWRDDNGFDWSPAVDWDLLANDLASIDAATLAVTYAHGLMTTPLGMTVAPDGRVIVVGIESHNEIRFEANLRGVFVRTEAAVLAPGGATPLVRGDLNPHLGYAVPQVPFLERLASIGDPRMVVAHPDGTRAYAAGMGSSNIVAFAPSTLARLGRCEVGEGPTGIALHAAQGRLFVLNRFASSVSVVDESAMVELAEIEFFDPIPFQLTRGRKFLYDTHLTSGLGQASCASCHIDGRLDGLVWDMGSPDGAMGEFNQVCNLELGVPDDCTPWHPMKGPMATQTLLGLAGNEPFHWRGDRAYIANFGHLARTLQGMERDYTETELKHLDDYLTAISMAPNPNRNRDGSLLASVADGDPVRGESLFRKGSASFIACAQCHASPSGGGAGVFSVGVLDETQQLAIPDLRQAFLKASFDRSIASPGHGFGFGHDGSGGSLVEFLGGHISGPIGAGASEADRRDLAAFVLSWNTGTHPAVGAQVTVDGSASSRERRDALVDLADAGHATLTAKCVVDGVERGYLYDAGALRTDADGASTSLKALDALAAGGVRVTYTLVPNGMGLRAIDRDGDGFMDGDERAACSDPSDPSSVPNACRADIAGGDGVIDAGDLALVLASWSGSGGPADIDCDGSVGASDLAVVLAEWGSCGGG